VSDEEVQQEAKTLTYMYRTTEFQMKQMLKNRKFRNRAEWGILYDKVVAFLIDRAKMV
jgi:FKBP-type peptidyl-prolyl cis-trans isomerase (trigger factor)